ncbi:MAG TPA: hypothetical protein VGP19_03445 [Candidatus Acidoferrales bacterium]|jgi:hypothetical protein|nr:hypothetical protein [Candidatus Acidoferrales bacterium]
MDTPARTEMSPNNRQLRLVKSVDRVAVGKVRIHNHEYLVVDQDRLDDKVGALLALESAHATANDRIDHHALDGVVCKTENGQKRDQCEIRNELSLRQSFDVRGHENESSLF